MKRLGRQRQSGQTLAIAAAVMVAVVGGLAMVIDTGMFFVIQRQFRTAAEAGALRGAWYPDVCNVPAAGCHGGVATDARNKAHELADLNAGQVSGLCGSTPDVETDSGGLGEEISLPARVHVVTVTVKCEAGYSFGKILGLNHIDISASSAAVIGLHTANGEIGDMPQDASTCIYPPNGPGKRCLVARLID